MEAAKLGFSHVIVPAIHAPAASGRLANIDIIKCRTIEDALTVGPSLSHASYSVTVNGVQNKTHQMGGDRKVGPYVLSYSIANDSSPENGTVAARRTRKSLQLATMYVPRNSLRLLTQAYAIAA